MLTAKSPRSQRQKGIRRRSRLSSLETFLWGLGGAGVGYIAVTVLPILTSKARGKPIVVNVAYLFLALAVYVLAGGFVAAIIGDATEPKHAAFYGMGWDTLVRSGGDVILGGRVSKK